MCSILQFTKFIFSIAVSYTHLDVYKRQSSCCVSIKIIAAELALGKAYEKITDYMTIVGIFVTSYAVTGTMGLRRKTKTKAKIYLGRV